MKFSLPERTELATPTGGRFQVATLEQADAFCRRLAQSHYENFPVGSVLVPKRLRRHFHSVYAFARIADDIADERGASTDERLAALDSFERLLTSTEQNTGNPVFIALHATLRELDIPTEPLQRLLVAFRMDSEFHAPRSIADVERYCFYSANPVGELVLRIYGLFTPERAHSADAICTGLQMANFWQDISRDRQASEDAGENTQIQGTQTQGRVWLPADLLAQYNITAADILSWQSHLRQTEASHSESPCDSITARLTACLHEAFDLTAAYFERGQRLLATIPYVRLRVELAVTLAGGMHILHRTRQMGLRILDERPALGLRDALSIGGRTLALLLGSLNSLMKNES
jgi:squalene synthase HpnC